MTHLKNTGKKNDTVFSLSHSKKIRNPSHKSVESIVIIHFIILDSRTGIRYTSNSTCTCQLSFVIVEESRTIFAKSPSNHTKLLGQGTFISSKEFLPVDQSIVHHRTYYVHTNTHLSHHPPQVASIRPSPFFYVCI